MIGMGPGRGRPISAGTHRPHGVALVAAGVTALTGFAWQFTGATWSAWTAVTRPGPARLEDAIGLLAGASAVALTAWLAVAVLLSGLAAALPASVPLLGAVTRAIAPRLVRHGVAALIGAIVVGGSAGAAAAAAEPAPPTRVAASAMVNTASAVGGTGRAAGASMDPGWVATGPLLDPGWVPTPPPGPRARLVADARIVSPGRTRVGMEPDEYVVVRRGDTLWAIAGRHLGPGATDAEIAVEWPRWFSANRDVLGRDPDHLTPGERLRPPGHAGASAAMQAPLTSAGGTR